MESDVDTRDMLRMMDDEELVDKSSPSIRERIGLVKEIITSDKGRRELLGLMDYEGNMTGNAGADTTGRARLLEVAEYLARLADAPKDEDDATIRLA